MKNEAAYLKPIRSSALAAAGVFTVGPFVTVVRIVATVTTTAVFGGNNVTLTFPANVPEYIRVTPGSTITAAGVMEVAEMG